ncbi:hypothetical protein QQS21_002494 [Conoideocrella luteorostrata]|uniref:Uncharacterized protein n=1 Tax=Conoideocrella luteorostrata TaxID=1105319 RepID=A0AAJ0CVY1_9HYPO|nr:hypothetical protein QQS21_002494 [Conoideocrella luteorostrata]
MTICTPEALHSNASPGSTQYVYIRAFCLPARIFVVNKVAPALVTTRIQEENGNDPVSKLDNLRSDRHFLAMTSSVNEDKAKEPQRLYQARSLIHLLLNPRVISRPSANHDKDKNRRKANGFFDNLKIRNTAGITMDQGLQQRICPIDVWLPMEATIQSASRRAGIRASDVAAIVKE